MSGFSIADLHTAIVRSLHDRCLRVAGGLIARNGDRHEHCGTCQTQCGGEVLGFSGGVEVARVWGSSAIALRWSCQGCGREVTQETTALSSITDAEEVQRDPLCYKCRELVNTGVVRREASERTQS